MKQNLHAHGAYKLPHTNLRVLSARCTQFIHVGFFNQVKIFRTQLERSFWHRTFNKCSEVGKPVPSVHTCLLICCNYLLLSFNIIIWSQRNQGFRYIQYDYILSTSVRIQNSNIHAPLKWTVCIQGQAGSLLLLLLLFRFFLFLETLSLYSNHSEISAVWFSHCPALFSILCFYFLCLRFQDMITKWH